MKTLINTEDIMSRIQMVKDPELGVSIVDVGLIYEVKIESVGEKQRVRIIMTLTTPGCPMGQTIHRMIRDSLSDLPGINPEHDVVIDLVFDPPWCIEMMSEAAKAELGM